MQGQTFHRLQRPADPAGSQGEARNPWNDKGFRRIDVAEKCGADAEPHGIARRQHAHFFTAFLEERLDGGAERCGPCDARPLVRFNHLKMPGPADQNFGVVDGRAGVGRQSVEPVIADPDNRQPSAGHQLSSGRRALIAADAIALPPRRPLKVR